MSLCSRVSASWGIGLDRPIEASFCVFGSVKIQHILLWWSNGPRDARRAERRSHLPSENDSCSTVTDGKAEFATPFALNDSKGNWKVQVRDVISGLTAEQIVRR